jgi:hypothetical protein
VTSGISRLVGAQSFGGAHRDRVCVRVFIGLSVRACCELIGIGFAYVYYRGECACVL